MSKHDYSQGTVSAISEAILNSKNNISNTVLSIESMPYSWDTGIIHNVVTWFEVLDILGQKEQMGNSLEKADSKFNTVIRNIEKNDSFFSEKLKSTIDKISDVVNKITSLENDLSGYGQVNESHRWMNDKEAAIYTIKAYVTYDKKTNKYIYNWSDLSRDLRNSNNLSYEELIKILETFIGENGDIDTDSLEEYLKVLATNGQYYASNHAPDPSKENALVTLAIGLEQCNGYYLTAIKSDNIDENTRKVLISKLSLNNIVIAASKTIKVTETKTEYSSYSKVESLDDIKNGDKVFVGDDGNLYVITKLQPQKQWFKTDKTLQELQQSGITYKIEDDGIYILKYPNEKTVYETKVDIAISKKPVSYINENGETIICSESGRYDISSGTSRCIVYDYTTSSKRAVANNFENEYDDYIARIINGELDSLKKDEKGVEKTICDRATKKVNSDIQKTIKKYSLKMIEELVPGFTFVEGIIEDIGTNVYGVYSDSKDVEEYNESIEKIKKDYAEYAKAQNRIDRIGDKIAEGNDVGVAVIVYFDDAQVEIQK